MTAVPGRDIFTEPCDPPDLAVIGRGGIATDIGGPSGPAFGDEIVGPPGADDDTLSGAGRGDATEVLDFDVGGLCRMGFPT